MLIPLDFAELHNALFLNGSNLQMKLDPKNKQGLILVYDRTEKELIVTYNGKIAIIPSSNVSSMTPSDPNVLGQVKTASMPQPKAYTHKGPIKAQVSSPIDHVFAQGPGKVRE